MVFFFFTGTATTEIYTYGHTLSLRDALPISAGRAGQRRQLAQPDPGRAGEGLRLPAVQAAPGAVAGVRHARRAGRRMARQQAAPADAHPRQRRVRSEEHTSELQSLMRISYAVFCLKKQNITYILKPVTIIIKAKIDN